MKQAGMKQQRGGTFLGFVIGVVVGLACALAVAVYVTKVPVPFMNKGQTRSADQDVEEAKKNKDWDPNAPLYGKNPARTAPAATPTLPAASAPVAAAAVPAPAPAAAAKPEARAAASADPIGELAKSKAAASGSDPFVYWVQVGAYRTAEDAESQRAKLSLGGIETKISEREQSGRTVFRLRVGPFESKAEGEAAKEKLDKSGLETALVRVQR